MKKSLMIIAVAAFATLTTMLIAERNYSSVLQQQAAFSQPDSAALAMIANVQEEPQATLDESNAGNN